MGQTPTEMLRRTFINYHPKGQEYLRAAGNGAPLPGVAGEIAVLLTDGRELDALAAGALVFHLGYETGAIASQAISQMEWEEERVKGKENRRAVKRAHLKSIKAIINAKRSQGPAFDLMREDAQIAEIITDDRCPSSLSRGSIRRYASKIRNEKRAPWE